MLLALGIGYFWFSEIPNWWTILGATIIIVSGIAILWREQWLGRQRNLAQISH
jgi:drug/metabolite transporter (DMT)-like permease